MKAKIIKFERLINTGNFSHDKIGIEIEVEEGEKAQDVLNKAKRFIDKQINRPTEQDRNIAKSVSEFDEDKIPF